jgi:hypothetical protein
VRTAGAELRVPPNTSQMLYRWGNFLVSNCVFFMILTTFMWQVYEH